MADWTDQTKNIIEAIAVIIGGGWALYRFGLFRERFPSMEVENGINYIGENSTEYLLELFCFVTNKGKVRKWIAPLEFQLLFLKEDSPFIKDKKLNGEIRFFGYPENDIIGFEKTYWILPTWHIPFVDGESKRRFQYLVAVPKTYKYLSLFTRFIDFKSRKKAISYFRPRKDKDSIQSDLAWEKNKWEQKKREENEKWEKTGWNERIDSVLSKKTDFYFAQLTLAIDVIKQNSTQQKHL